VEVAAYRIVQEALTNVVRHAHASHCTIRLNLVTGEASVLEVEVADDGVGVPETPILGVGLRSMRERAAELGGSCQVMRAAEGGTRIRASLPIAPTAMAATLVDTPAVVDARHL
jgi:signal transduction histidine kinase